MTSSPPTPTTETSPDFRKPSLDSSSRRRNYRRRSPSSSPSPSSSSPEPGSGGHKRRRSVSPGQEGGATRKTEGSRRRESRHEYYTTVKDTSIQGRRRPGDLVSYEHGQNRNYRGKYDDRSCSSRHSRHHGYSGRDSRRDEYRTLSRLSQRSSPERNYRNRVHEESRDRHREWRREKLRDRDDEFDDCKDAVDMEPDLEQPSQERLRDSELGREKSRNKEKEKSRGGRGSDSLKDRDGMHGRDGSSNNTKDSFNHESSRRSRDKEEKRGERMGGKYRDDSSVEDGQKPSRDERELDEFRSKWKDDATGNSGDRDSKGMDKRKAKEALKGRNIEEESPDGKKHAKSSKWSDEPAATTATEAEVANDLSNAKLLAMRAAEMVNKNLGASGFRTADEKKKLLWGSKKAEEQQDTGSKCWETVHFSDPERQGKFNKLMGVKGEAKVMSQKMNEKDSGVFTEERQKELQLDLEKQFSAGMRRRDGRTVGLGL